MSLHRKLLVGIALVLLLMGGIATLIGGYNVRHEAGEMLDQNLIQVAQLALNAPAGALEPPPLSGRARHERRESELVATRWSGNAVTNLASRTVQLPRPMQSGFGDASADGRAWRTYAVQTGDGWMLVAEAVKERDDVVRGALLSAVLPMLLALPLIGLLIALLIRRTLAPMHRLAQSMEQRPPLSTTPLAEAGLPREMLPVVGSFNQLLARVNTAVERERGFITDAAHALRTPITAVQLQAESLREARSRSDFSQRLDELIAGIARGHHTVEQLLTLARAEHAGSGSTLLPSLLRLLPERCAAALAARAITLQLAVTVPDQTHVALHPHALNIVLDNLLDNAIRYSPAGGVIRVVAGLNDSTVRISVRDQGPGLPQQELERVFDRFYRPANDTTHGTGLGLAIVRGICEAAGGRAWLEPPSDGNGLIAVFELPASAE